MEWQVLLTGDEYDLSELPRSLGGPDLMIEKGEDGFTLKWSGMEDLTEVSAVRDKAHEIIGLLDGAARIVLGTRVSIGFGGVALIRPDGSRVHYASGSATTRTGARVSSVTLRHDDGTEEVFNLADPAAEWVRIGLSDRVVADVLRLVALKPLDWVNLYRILEVIGEDVGGRHGISGRRWATKAALDRFRHTANSRAAIGDEARHGKEHTQPPSDPMTLAEARSLIETVLHNWMRTKQQSREST
jgi:hypothetical protein